MPPAKDIPPPVAVPLFGLETLPNSINKSFISILVVLTVVVFPSTVKFPLIRVLPLTSSVAVGLSV